MNKSIAALASAMLLVSGLVSQADAAVKAQNANHLSDSATLLDSDRGVSFNDGWRFHLGDINGAERADFNDSDWRNLALPHDWAIEGDFSDDNPSGAGGGALPGGIGWYRKSFTIPESARNKKIFIDFDGAYMNSSVYINGQYAGGRPYGYASFSVDVTDLLNKDGDNTIAVKVDNAEQPNSRWYSGCGIYRNVWFRPENAVYIPKDGTYITTDDNKLRIATTIDNTTSADRHLTVRSRVTDAAGRCVATVTTPAVARAGKSAAVHQATTVTDPALWSPASPALYTVTTTITDTRTGETLDTDVTRTGFRTFEFDAEKGFSLNGKRMKLNGVCLHHDAGALGAVVNRASIQRQLSMLKDMGCNAIRCTHNPPAPELLDLCDEMGLMVMDEAFDMWRKRKTTYDYARYFNEWHERDLDDFIRRDRNHPSIIVWSIGNEVLEQWNDAAADTLSLAEANLILNFGHSPEQLATDGEMSVNSLLTKKLADRVRSLDPTRPVTAGCNEAHPDNHLFRSNALDIIGFNYHDGWFAGVPDNFPGKPFVVTESVSGLMTRGFYMMPSDHYYIWPDSWDRPFYHESLSCSSYDNCYVPWGNYHEGTMKHVRDNDFISGQFVWTGFDYLGEPTPYEYPARSSYFGIIDLAGFPKDIYYLYQSEWQNDTDVLHLFPHWNWEEGKDVDVWAYYNNADEVELYLNGESVGVSAKTPDRLHAFWRLPFTPGTLTAVSRRNGKEVARDTVVTAGEPYALRLTPDRDTISADGYDLCYLTAEVVDADGNVCPWADNEITFAVDGTAFNAGVDNGCQFSHERFKADNRKAFYGKALLIAQNNGEEGAFTVTATAPGLQPAAVTLSSKQ